MISSGSAGSLTARCIVLSAEQRLEPGEIAWDARGRVTRLAKATKARGPAADVVVIPGLVDAHSHVQIDRLARAPRSFVPWLKAVMAARAGDSEAAERRRTVHAARGLLAEGVTAIGDIDSTGRALASLAPLGFAGRVYRELTGFHLDRAASTRLVRERSQPDDGALRSGLSPHAPYSVSEALLAAAKASGRHLAIHCAETEEEQRFLRTGSGPFAELLAAMGRLPAGFRAPRTGAVRWLERLGLLSPKTALVHCQELERGDPARIAASGAAIVVCPATIAWFRREPPPVERWLAAGIPVALGTDSPASSARFSFRAELAAAARLWPSLHPARLFTMATGNGAAALGIRGLGRLRRGGRADFVVLPAPAGRAPFFEAFVHGAGEPIAVHAGGVAVAGSAVPAALRR